GPNVRNERCRARIWLARRRREAGCRARRFEMRAEKSFADVDVAEPGDNPLIEQKALQVAAPAGGVAREIFGRQVWSERLDAEVCEQRMRVERRGGRKIHET